MDIKTLNDTKKKRKEELIQLVIRYGFSHKKGIRISQELDHLIYQLMRKSNIH